MSVLEKIRSKTGLLIGFTGVALLIFILQSALETGSSFFGSSQRAVGRIAGKDVDVNELSAKVNEYMANYQASGQMVDDQTKQMIVDQSWATLVNEKVIKPEFNKLGITVGEEELVDLMLVNPHSSLVQYFTDRQTGKIYPDFAKPDGSLDVSKINTYVQSLKPEQLGNWTQVENSVLETRINEKYYNLIKKGIYVTNLEAKNEYVAQNTSFSVKFVSKKYSEIGDSSITVTDEEVQKYYNENQDLFQNEEEVRKIDYLVWEATPSDEDIKDIMKNMLDVSNDFKTRKTPAEDSALMLAENENSIIDINTFKKSTLGSNFDSTFYTNPVIGNVYGPFIENGMVKVSKLLKTGSVLDSAKVRHILLAYQGSGASPTVTRSKEQAKKLADSLSESLKKPGSNFAALVKTYSDDGGKQMPQDKKETDEWMGKDGNYGWLNENSGFVEPFKKFGLEGTKGKIGVVESNFGYHIMEVLDVSAGKSSNYEFATISRKIQPSDNTLQKTFAQATEFSGKNNTTELFEKAIDKEKLNKRIADNIKENDKTISGIESPKELIRWVYNIETKKGNVSQAFSSGNRFIVACLNEIKEKGTLPLESVKEDVVTKVKREKKAEKFMSQIKAAGASDIISLSQKLKSTVDTASNVLFSGFSLGNYGREDAVLGAIASLKKNTISKPIKGEQGVYVVLVEKVNDKPVKDYKANQKNLMANMSSRVDYEVYNALRKMANIEDHKARFDF